MSESITPLNGQFIAHTTVVLKPQGNFFHYAVILKKIKRAGFIPARKTAFSTNLGFMDNRVSLKHPDEVLCSEKICKMGMAA